MSAHISHKPNASYVFSTAAKSANFTDHFSVEATICFLNRHVGDNRAQFPRGILALTSASKICFFAVGLHSGELCGPHKVGSQTVGLLTDKPFTVDLNAKLIFGKPEDLE